MTKLTSTQASAESIAGLVSHAEFEEIPIIDVGPFLAGTPGALENVAAQIHRASTEIGFYFVVNHGMSQDIVDGAMDASKKFHGMPASEKARVQMNEHQCGWQGGGIAVHGDSLRTQKRPTARKASSSPST